MFAKPARRQKPRRRCFIGDDPVSVRELRGHVILRDGKCILRGEPGHVCKGRYGAAARYDSDYTLEHVTGVHGPSDVRRDDDEHCVALDYATNVKPPSTEEREIMRRELRKRFPECRAAS